MFENRLLFEATPLLLGAAHSQVATIKFLEALEESGAGDRNNPETLLGGDCASLYPFAGAGGTHVFRTLRNLFPHIDKLTQFRDGYRIGAGLASWF